MRIGLVTGEYPPAVGGVGDHTRRLAQALAARGHAVEVVTTGSETASGPAGRPGDVQVWRTIPRWDWRLLGAVRRLAQRQAWDVVHIQYQPAAYGLHGAIALLPWWLRRGGRGGGGRHGPVVVTTFHDVRVPYLFPKAGRLRQLAVRHLARASHAVIAVAEEDQAALVAWIHGAARPAVALVPLGNHFDAPPPPDFERRAWRASLGITPETFLLGHLGLVNRSKGIDALVRAAGTLRAAGREIGLLMIGEPLGASDPTNAAYLEEIRRLVESLDLGPVVRWTGYQPPARVAAWLRCLELAVLPFADGPTLRRTSLIGAWSQGVPVLTTTPPRPAEWLRDCPAAATVPDADVEVLAAAIAALQDAPARRAVLAEAGRAFASRFSWPEVAEQTLAAYGAACGIRDGGGEGEGSSP